MVFMSFIASKIIRLLQLYFYHLIVCEAKLLIIVLSIRWWHDDITNYDMMTWWQEASQTIDRMGYLLLSFTFIPLRIDWNQFEKVIGAIWYRDNSWFQYQQAFRLKRYRGVIPYLLFAKIYKIIKSIIKLSLLKTLLLVGTSLSHAALASIKNYFATNEETITRAISIVFHAS